MRYLGKSFLGAGLGDTLRISYNGLLAYHRPTIDTIGVSPAQYFPDEPAGTKYYVSPQGSNTAPYDTWEKAANLPSTAMSHGEGVAGPHVMYVAPGSYDDTLYIGDADWANGYMIGTAAHGSTLPAVKGQVTIASSTSFTIRVVSQNLTLKNLSITQNGSHIPLYVSAGAGFTGYNLLVFDPSGTTYVMNTSVTGSKWYGCNFLGSTGTQAIDINGTGVSAEFNFCIFGPSDTKQFGVEGLRNAGTGTVTLNNCIIGGSSGGKMLRNSSTGSIVANNTIILPPSIPGYPITSALTGAITLNNCLTVRDFSSAHYQHEGNVTVNSCIEDDAPSFTRHARNGVLVFSIDDLYVADRLDYVLSVEQVLAARGLKGTWYVDAKSIPGNETALQGIASRGVFEIACHTYSHSTQTTTGDVCTITKAGATINVDRTADTITVSPGGTVTGFRSKSLSDIYTELEGLGCTNSGFSAGLNTSILGEVLQDSGGTQASPYSPQVLVDVTAETGLFYVDMIYAKQLLETAIQPAVPSYICRTYATPGGTSNSTVEAAIKNAGFDGHRHGYSGCSYNLDNIDVFARGFMQWDTFLGNTVPEMTTNIKALCEAVAEYGLCFDILAHDTSEATASEWGAILDVIINNYPEISMISHAEFIDMVSQSPWTTSDQKTYSRTWDSQADYTLSSGSPCINAGTDPFSDGDGNQYDAAGYMVWSDDFDAPVYHWRDGVDIGAYTYGGGSKVKNTPTVISGTDMSNYVLEWPICPTLSDADDGTLYTAYVPNQINMATFTSLAWMRKGSKGVAIWDRNLDTAEQAKADKVLGA